MDKAAGFLWFKSEKEKQEEARIMKRWEEAVRQAKAMKERAIEEKAEAARRRRIANYERDMSRGERNSRERMAGNKRKEEMDGIKRLIEQMSSKLNESPAVKAVKEVSVPTDRELRLLRTASLGGAGVSLGGLAGYLAGGSKGSVLGGAAIGGAAGAAAANWDKVKTIIDKIGSKFKK